MTNGNTLLDALTQALGADGKLDPVKVEALLAAEGTSTRYAMADLVW